MTSLFAARRALAATVALSAMGASPAMAASPRIDYQNPDMEVYAGPLIGYDSVVLNSAGSTAGRSGIAYGGVVGVDTRTGDRSRLGFEAEIMGASTSYRENIGSLTGKLSAGRDIFVGVKFGYMVAPHLHTYAKVGYSNLKANIDAFDSTGANVLHLSPTLNGVRVGVGTEYLLDKVRLRLEYRYTDYGELVINGLKTGASFDRHQVVAGMIYGF
jgi:outer membrane immunogenic protein